MWLRLLKIAVCGSQVCLLFVLEFSPFCSSILVNGIRFFRWLGRLDLFLLFCRNLGCSEKCKLCLLCRLLVIEDALLGIRDDVVGWTTFHLLFLVDFLRWIYDSEMLAILLDMRLLSCHIKDRLIKSFHIIWNGLLEHLMDLAEIAYRILIVFYFLMFLLLFREVSSLIRKNCLPLLSHSLFLLYWKNL